MAITFADTWQPDVGFPYLFTKHPPPRAEAEAMDDDKLKIYAALMEQKPWEADPVKWGWRVGSWQPVLDNWKKYHTHVILGGNRSSKSTLCARLCVDMALSLPDAKIRCWSTNEDSSIVDQQKMLWEAIPAGYKALKTKRGAKDVSLQWTQKNGFSGNKAIFPPMEGAQSGGEIIFQTYKSFGNDPQVAEGWWAHMIWLDEECPQKLFETLQYRRKDARGRIFLSFTTVAGWSPLIADILGKTRTLKRRQADLVGRELPIVQESLSRPGTVIWYFWTEDNPFYPWEDHLADLKGRPLHERLSRAYGVPMRSVDSKFPLFEEDVHVVKGEELPWVKNPKYVVTRYCTLDPAGRKNWFFLWGAVDAADTLWIYREWPDQSMGDWAEPGNDAKGKSGPAQQGLGYGIKDYVELVKDLEDGEAIFERYIDSRLGNAEKQAKEGATSINMELQDEGMDFLSAPGLNEEHGLQLINDRLAYDQDEAVSVTNAPRLYVSDRCQNLIFALKNYTAAGGRDEATKDPIDCLRYMLEAGADFVDGKAVEVTGVGSY